MQLPRGMVLNQVTIHLHLRMRCFNAKSTQILFLLQKMEILYEETLDLSEKGIFG